MTTATQTYQPIYKPNQIICGTGNTIIVTGWTVKDAIAKKLSPHQYAGIGNLYSPTRGISPLIRNICANPFVKKVVGLSATKEDSNSGGVRCLHDFFKNGVREGIDDAAKKAWVINSDIKGFIDIEIPLEVLEQIRARISFYLYNKRDDLLNSLSVGNDDDIPFADSPLLFPEPTIKTTILPSNTYGHRIECETIAETWIKIIHRIRTTGTIRPNGYDANWQELINLTAVITNEQTPIYFPDPNFLPFSRQFLDSYFDQILSDASMQNGTKYTYGQRLRSWFGVDQIEQVIEKLINEIDAASAVMSLWDVKDHTRGGSPCLNHIWLRVVENKLSLTALFRSNDMFSAWPANAMGLRALQQHIRDEIAVRSNYDLDMGYLMTISQSAHIYDDTWENVDELIKTKYEEICNKKTYSDPCGNFLIEARDNRIWVKQTTPSSGVEVAEYSDKDPLRLIRKICQANPSLQPEHIGYLGIELGKAERSLVENLEYVQDK